ncbi:CsiV family protein [Cellvibrio japonicus]|uniref:CsiV family protein n=1 Tax=Cellvibrio japonicus TaxID=155077 RepID=UPI000303E409|nr:CsiV family protein [Cellvibrio japonicus]QEI12275.1 hypothetical protein FY117_08580 [Cellvibrio japonicus]QEI15849.1 hypothetical protein FY116_08585 [Cellvibrio japonicus]QEI19427.1 hypothetical protein FY115_08580 [Cellvibrio japonicus]
MLLSQSRLHLSILLILLTVGGSCAANAQGRNEGWYQVELVVFARRNAKTEEHWPRDIKLRYPSRWVELKNPNQTSSHTDNTHTSASGSTNVDLTREPYWLLPATERTLNDQAHRLAHNSGYQLLFHEAWRQPVTSAKNAQGILISGGQSYGKHLELEGSITLSVATYLKLSTTLWFTQFNVNVDQATAQEWPSIPLRPNYRPASQPALTLESDINLLDDPLADWSTANVLAAEEESTPYVPRQIVLMKEVRDMRSNEVHYLDHPLLGVIVKVTPYNPTGTSQ